MDISADFISSVLYNPAGTCSAHTADNNNNNSSCSNNINADSAALNNAMLQTTTAAEIQELHLLGLHFEDFSTLPCEQIRSLPTPETNNNHFSYTNNGPPSFDSQTFNCPPAYDPKSEISWPGPPSNTDGAIYSFEIVNDNTNSSSYWDDDNLSPITTALNQSPYQNAISDELSPSEKQETPLDDYQCKQKVCADSTRNDFDSRNVLLRNALMGKSTGPRYSEKSKSDEYVTIYSPPVKQTLAAQTSSQVYFLRPEPNTATPLPCTIPHIVPHRATIDPSLDHQSANMFRPGPSESTDAPFIDEIVLPDFDSFSYADEQFNGMTTDLADAIQQFCGNGENYITPPYGPPSVATSLTTGSSGSAAADVVTTNSVDPLVQNQMPTSSRVRRPRQKLHGRSKSNNSHRSNGDISLSNEYGCASNASECNSSNVSSNSGANGVCSSSSVASSSSGASSTSGASSSSVASSTSGASSSTSSTSGGSTTSGRKERLLHHCAICKKGFKDKYSVNVHTRTHTGEKPFVCAVCHKCFRQKAHLAKHQHTHYQKKSHSPPRRFHRSSPNS